MNNNKSESLDKVEYKDVLQEEIQNFLEKESSMNYENLEKKNSVSRIKRTPLEIINRLLFFLFIGSFIFSFASVYYENKTWFVFYIISAFSCIFYMFDHTHFDGYESEEESSGEKFLNRLYLSHRIPKKYLFLE